MNKPQYTLRDFKLARMVAIFITIFFWGTYSIVRIGEMLAWSEVFVFPIGLSCYFMPVLLILSWSMCYERYMYLTLQTVVEDSKRKVRRQVFINVLVLGFIAIITYGLFFNVINYLCVYWEYMKFLYGCITLLVLCSILWLLWLMVTVNKGKKGKLKSNIYINVCFIGVTIMLIIGTGVCVSYAYDKGEGAWYFITTFLLITG